MALNNLCFVSFLLCSTLCSVAQESLEQEILHKILKINEISRKVQEEVPNASLHESILETFPKTLPGLATGNFYHLGDFDHCHNVQKGKYCLGYYVMAEDFFQEKFQRNSLDFPVRLLLGSKYKQKNEAARLYYGVCVPEDFPLGEFPSNFTFSEENCYHQSDAKLPTATLIITFSAIIYLSCVVCVTFWDFCYDLPSSSLKLFSVLQPIKQLLLAPKSEISCLDGLKTLLTFLTLFGHLAGLYAYGPVSDYFILLEAHESYIHPLINRMVIVVDGFFVISGLLNAFHFYKKDKFSLFQHVKHRYLRLAPLFRLITVFYIFCLEHLGKGPLWKLIRNLAVEPCRKYWWKNVLFIGTFDLTDGYICPSHTWTVNTDMQLFVLSPVILLALRRSARIGLMLAASLLLTGSVLSINKLYSLELGLYQNWEKYFVEFYTQLQYRFPPYLIGLLAGYFLHKSQSRNEVFLAKKTQDLLWYSTIFIAVCSFWVGFDGTPLDLGAFTKPLVLVLNRQLFCIAFSGIILMCYKFGGRTDAFLSKYIFRLLSKFSFSISLVHFFIIMVRYSAMKTTYSLNGFLILRNTLMDIFWILLCSVLTYLLVETRVVELERYFSKKTTKTH